MRGISILTLISLLVNLFLINITFAATSIPVSGFTIKVNGGSSIAGNVEVKPLDNITIYIEGTIGTDVATNVEAQFSFSNTQFLYQNQATVDSYNWMQGGIINENISTALFFPGVDNTAPIILTGAVGDFIQLNPIKLQINADTSNTVQTIGSKFIATGYTGPELFRNVYINSRPHITNYYFTKSDGTTTTSTIQGSSAENISLILKVKDYNGCINIDGGSVTANLSLLGLSTNESLVYDSCEADGFTTVFKKNGISTLEAIGTKTFTYSDFSATDEDGNIIKPNDPDTSFDDEDKKIDLLISVVAADAPTVNNLGLTDDYIGSASELSSNISFSGSQSGTSKIALDSCTQADSAKIIQDWSTYTGSLSQTTTINSSSLLNGANTVFVCIKNSGGNTGSFNFNITKDTVIPAINTVSYSPSSVITGNSSIDFICNENGNYKIDRILPSTLNINSYSSIIANTNKNTVINNSDLALGTNTFIVTCKDNAGNIGTYTNISIQKDPPTPSMAGEITLFEDGDIDLNGLDGRDLHITWNTANGTGFSGFESWRIYLLPSNVTLDTSIHSYIKLNTNSASGSFIGDSSLTIDSNGNTLIDGQYKAYIAILGASGQLGVAGESTATTLTSDVVSNATVLSAKFTSDTILELSTDTTIDSTLGNNDATLISFQINGVTSTLTAISSVNGTKINITIPSIGSTDKTGTNLIVKAGALHSAGGGFNNLLSPSLTITDGINPTISSFSKSTAAIYSTFYKSIIDFSWNISEAIVSGSSYIEFIRTSGNTDSGTNKKSIFSASGDLVAGSNSKTINLNLDNSENIVLNCGTTYEAKLLIQDIAGNTSISSSITNLSFDNCSPTVPNQTLVSLENTLTPTINWSASTDDSGNGSGIKNYTLNLYNGIGCSGGINQTYTLNATSKILSNLGTDKSNYSWKILATDNMDNISAYSSCDDFYVNTTVPAISNELINDNTISSTQYITQSDSITITADITNTDSNHIWLNLSQLTGNASHTGVLCSAAPIDGISCGYSGTTATYTLTSGASIIDGIKQVEIRSQNISGLNEQTKIISIIADSTNPTVAADTISSPTGIIGGNSTDIIWDQAKITDGLGIDHIVIQYSTGANVQNIVYSGSNTSPYSWDITNFSSANDYKLQLTAYDLVGNNTTTAFPTFQIDKIAPVVPNTTITYPNGGEILAGNSSINILWNSGSITDSSLATNPITLEYTVDGTNWIVIAQNQANDGTYTWTTPQIDNTTIKIKLTANDSVGNKTSDTSNSNFVIDNTSPSFTFSYPSTPPNNSGLNNSGIDIKGSTSDTNLFKTYYRFKNITDNNYWNGSTYTTDTWNTICTDGQNLGTDNSCDSLSISINPTVIDSNTYRLEIKSSDEAGNQTISVPLDYSGDTINPVVSITTASGTYFTNTGTITGTSSDAGIGIGSVKLQIKKGANYWNGVNFQAGVYTLNTNSSNGYTNWNYNFIPNGGSNDIYEIKAIAYDNTYKTSNLSETTITLNEDAVSPSITGGVNLLNFTTGEIISGGAVKTINWTTGNITDPDSGLIANPISLEYLSGATWVSITTNQLNDGTYSWTVPSIDLSGTKVRLVAIDNLGNTSNQESNSFIIDSTGPVISFTNTNTPNSGSFINSNGIDITGLSSDISMDKVYYRLKNNTSGDYWNVGNSSYTGAVIWNLICTDGLIPGTDNSCNSISFSTSANVIDGNSYSISLKATDEALNETISTIYSYTGDTVNPNISITTSSGSYFQNSINIVGTSSDLGAGISNVKIQIKNGANYWDGSNFVATIQTLNTATVDTYANWNYNFNPSGTNENYNIKVISYDNSYKVNNSSESTITTNQDTIIPSIAGGTGLFNITSGEILAGTDIKTITWTTGNITDIDSGLATTTPILLEYFNGTSWNTVANIDNNGSYSWTLPSIDTSSAKIRFTITDAVGNTNTQLSESFIIDSTAPTISQIETMDMDADGQIDALQVTMSESITDSSIVVGDFSISNGIGIPTGYITGGSANDSIFILQFTNNGDTAAVPNLTYTKGTLSDLAGKKLATANNFISFDRAIPRLLSSNIYDSNTNGKLDKIIATFSENLNSTTDTSVWTLNNSLVGTSISSVSITNNTAIILLTEGSNIETSVLTMDLTFNSNSNWKDSASNQSGNKANLAIGDLALPLIISSEYTDNNSNYITDKVTITLSENISGFNINDFVLSGLTKNNGSITNNIITINLTESGSSDSGVTANFNYTNNSNLKDVANNFVATKNNFSIDDKVAPKLESKLTIDSNSNGKIDTIRLTFSEDIGTDFSSYVAEIDGYTLTGTPYSKNGNNIVEIAVNEKATADTGATPQYKVSSNTSLKDLAGNNVETSTFSNLTDGVGPIIIGARYDSGVNKLFLTFSEAINNTDFITGNFVLNNAGGYSVASINTGEKSITLSSETVTYGSTEVSFTINSIGDTLGNKQGATNFAKVSAPIIINEVMISDTENNNYIELKNLSSSIVSMSGWTIAGVTIPGGTNISANGYFLISESNQATSIINVAPDIIDINLTLAGTSITLNDTVIDIDFAKLDTGLNSTTTPKSIERKSNPGDGSLTTSWYTSQISTGFDNGIPFGTPKSANVFDATSPTVNAYFPNDNELLPLGSFDLTFNYTDNAGGLGVDTSTDSLTLFKYNTGSTSYNIDSISSVNVAGKSISTTKSIYPVNNLAYGKYQAVFKIDDLAGNTETKTLIFYVDEFEFTIDSNSLSIGTLSIGDDNISTNEITVTIKTVGAGFNLNMDKIGLMTDGTSNIIDWNTAKGFGFDVSKNENGSSTVYSNALSSISSNNIGVIAKSINTNGEKNIFTYKLKYGANIDTIQQAGTYNSNVGFKLSLTY